MLSASIQAAIRFPLPGDLFRSARIGRDLVSTIRRLLSAVQERVALHAPQVARHRARETFLVSFRESEDCVFEVVKRVIQEVVHQAILDIHVSARCTRVTHVAQPRPIIHVPPRLASEKEKDGCRASVVVVAMGERPRLVSHVMNIGGAHRNKILFQCFRPSCVRREVSYRPPLKFHLDIFNNERCPLNRVFHAGRRASVWLKVQRFFFRTANRGAIFRVVVFCQEVLLSAARATVVVNRRRPIFQCSCSQAGTARASGNVHRAQLLQVVWFVCERLRAGFSRCPIYLLVLLGVSR